MRITELSEGAATVVIPQVTGKHTNNQDIVSMTG